MTAVRRAALLLLLAALPAESCASRFDFPSRSPSTIYASAGSARLRLDWTADPATAYDLFLSSGASPAAGTLYENVRPPIEITGLAAIPWTAAVAEHATGVLSPSVTVVPVIYTLGTPETLAVSIDGYFGSALATGDLDGDGIADLAASAPEEGSATGRVVAFHEAGGAMVELGEVTGPLGFGRALAIGDSGGDGAAELLAGSPLESIGFDPDSDVPAFHQGRVHVFAGSTLQEVRHLDGLQADDAFGFRVAVVGGRAVVGAREFRRPQGGSTDGAMLVYPPGSVHGEVMTVAEPGALLGSSFGDAPDFLAAGAPGVTLGTASNVGAVAVLEGRAIPPGPDPIPSSRLVYGRTPNEGFGSSVAVGDFDGDGEQDLAAGSPARSGGDDVSAAGAVSVFRGQRGGPRGSAEWVFEGTEGSASLGASLATGDFDGDGFDDLAAGAPGASEGSGRLSLFLGGPAGLPRGPDLVEEGVPFASLGGSLASADFDGDGRADLAAGAMLEGGCPTEYGCAGAVHVWHGTVSRGPRPVSLVVTRSGRNASLALSFVATRPGAHSCAIDWGDGTETVDCTGGALARDHVYASGGTRDVRVRVTGPDGTTGEAAARTR